MELAGPIRSAYHTNTFNFLEHYGERIRRLYSYIQRTREPNEAFCSPLCGLKGKQQGASALAPNFPF